MTSASDIGSRTPLCSPLPLQSLTKKKFPIFSVQGRRTCSSRKWNSNRSCLSRRSKWRLARRTLRNSSRTAASSTASTRPPASGRSAVSAIFPSKSARTRLRGKLSFASWCAGRRRWKFAPTTKSTPAWSWNRSPRRTRRVTSGLRRISRTERWSRSCWRSDSRPRSRRTSSGPSSRPLSAKWRRPAILPSKPRKSRCPRLRPPWRWSRWGGAISSSRRTGPGRARSVTVVIRRTRWPVPRVRPRNRARRRSWAGNRHWRRCWAPRRRRRRRSSVLAGPYRGQVPVRRPSLDLVIRRRRRRLTPSRPGMRGSASFPSLTRPPRRERLRLLGLDWELDLLVSGGELSAINTCSDRSFDGAFHWLIDWWSPWSIDWWSPSSIDWLIDVLSPLFFLNSNFFFSFSRCAVV